MQIRELINKLKRPKVMGFLDNGPVDQSRDVIVQVFRGYDEESGMAKYEYHDVRAVGMLFYGGAFKAVIAVGEDEDV